jgi:hypothetical protein
MPLQYGDTLRNNQAAQIQTSGGTGALLKIWAGTRPGTCGAADATPATNLLCTITLPTPTFMVPGTVGQAVMTGAWSGVGSANAGGGTNATHWRLYTSGAVCILQGDVTTDLILNNVNISTGQTVTINTFAITVQNG